MAKHLPDDHQRKHSSVSCESFHPSLDPQVPSRCLPYPAEYPDNLCDPSKLWSYSESSSIYSGGSSGYSSSASCYENSDASSDCSFSSFNSTSDFDHDQETELAAAHLTFDIDDGREESERLRLKISVELNFHTSRSRVELTVEQVEGKGGEALYIIHIATNHHAFTLKRSRTVRRMKDFKFLQSAMEGMHPYSNLPGE